MLAGVSSHSHGYQQGLKSTCKSKTFNREDANCLILFNPQEIDTGILKNGSESNVILKQKDVNSAKVFVFHALWLFISV